MKRINKLAFIATVCSAFLFTGCKSDWEMQEQKEYHFYKSEYDEQYDSFDVVFDLDNKEHKIQIKSECESGEIHIASETDDSLSYTVTSENPLDVEFELPAENGDKFALKADIDNETQGSISIALYSR